MSFKVYAYAGCGTCRKAIQFLTRQGIAFEVVPIRETPPSRAELETMLGHVGGELRKLFNTSGRDYQALNLKDKLPKLAPAAVLDLLAGNGNLIKRPFVLGKGFGLVGFDEAKWSERF
jgi:arsenate reductase